MSLRDAQVQLQDAGVRAVTQFADVSRRRFIRAALAGAATPYVLLSASGTRGASAFTVKPGRRAETVFGCSIASGDPTANGVVLWTRVNPEVWTRSRALGVQVATDSAGRDLVLRVEISGQEFGPESDYTVRLLIDEGLDPETRYFYRFVYNETASRTGRCRTLPLPGTAIDRLKLAVVTC
jgi:alkaline phosphatase D